MVLSWQIVDLRARVEGGCYFIGLCHELTGDVWVARYCTDPRNDATWSSGSKARIKGIGHSTDLEEIKTMCGEDADHNIGKMRVY
jgi:hypothetical protein